MKRTLKLLGILLVITLGVRPVLAATALVGGTVHPVSGPAIPGGIVVLDNGKIIAVGANVSVPSGAESIDVSGLHVYPGMIAANTVLGLVEVNSVPGTVDNNESGELNPNLRAKISINPDSELIPVTRANGVLTVLSATSGGVISGTSVAWNLEGWTWEDWTVKDNVGIHIRWPSMTTRSGWRESRSEEEQKKDRDKKIQSLTDAFADARAYMTARDAMKAGGTHHPLDVRWEAMLPALNGEMPVFVHADEYQQIESALDFAVDNELTIILVGGRDAPKLADRLAAASVPVIIQDVLQLPRRSFEPYDAAYTVAKELHQAGVAFCISTGGSGFGAANIRNLPYHAAMAAAYGLPKEEALKAVTLYPAEILGIADRLGSLDAGKDANIIVTTGDPLEITSNVTMAWIAGERIDLGSRHTALYEKYRNRPRANDRETLLTPSPNTAGGH